MLGGEYQIFQKKCPKGIIKFQWQVVGDGGWGGVGWLGGCCKFDGYSYRGLLKILNPGSLGWGGGGEEVNSWGFLLGPYPV